MGEIAEPVDAPDFTPEEAHRAAVELAQEAASWRAGNVASWRFPASVGP